MGGSVTEDNMDGNYGDMNVFNKDNLPPGRIGTMNWMVEESGHTMLYLYGGETGSWDSSNVLDDCWLYDVSSRLWVWLYGSSDVFDTIPRDY
jgi:hypothetical protein